MKVDIFSINPELLENTYVTAMAKLFANKPRPEQYQLSTHCYGVPVCIFSPKAPYQYRRNKMFQIWRSGPFKVKLILFDEHSTVNLPPLTFLKILIFENNQSIFSSAKF